MSGAQPLGLLDLPLEIRHTIFKFLAQRDVKTKKLLRYWFEKKEVKELIAKQAIDNPGGRSAKAVYHDSHDDFDSSEQQHIDDIEDDDQDEDDNSAIEQDADDDEDQDEQDADHVEDGDEQHEQHNVTMDDDENTDTGNNAVASLTTAHFPAHTQSATSGQAVAHNEEDSDADKADNEAEQENEGAMLATHDGQDASMGGEEPVNEEDDAGPTQLDVDGAVDQNEELDGDLVEQQIDEDGDEQMVDVPSAPAPVVTAARKWRYVPNFMRITQCPPEVNLFLVSKQLSEEAKDWFYDVAVLRIEVTASFAHTSFFEEALTQIFDAAFSPMENIRKVEITFVWDTTWIRSVADDFIKAVFPALLRQRAECVQRILSHAPDLKEVTIHWHDSAQDDESANLKLDILDAFFDLPATIKVVEHYIAADAKPYKQSIAGKRRIEFQHIVDAGLDRLF